MLGRRIFANCDLCAVVALVAGAGGGDAQMQPLGINPKVLNTTEMPGVVPVSIEATIDIDINGRVARQTHPRIEPGYVLRGGGTLSVKSLPDRQAKPSDALPIPAPVHFFREGSPPIMAARLLQQADVVAHTTSRIPHYPTYSIPYAAFLPFLLPSGQISKPLFEGCTEAMPRVVIRPY